MLRYFILLLFIFISKYSFTQSRFDQVEIKSHQLRENIYMLEGSGGNIGLFIGQNEVLIIDSQFAPLSDKITAAIREISDLPIKWLVNTHWHGDHTGGNENFAGQGAIIVGHKNVLKRLSEESTRGDRVIPPANESARTDVAFERDLTLNVSGYNIYVHHVANAHTDGDSFVMFTKDNVLHMGDCFFKDRFPYIDLNSNGSVKGYLAAVEGALMMVNDETTIIPGHGSVADKEDLKSFQKMLSTILSRMEDEVSSGKSLDEIDVSKITEGYDGWGEGYINYDRIVEVIFNDLSK